MIKVLFKSTVISFRPFPRDLDDWVKLGCSGWDNATIQPYGDRLLNYITPVHSEVFLVWNVATVWLNNFVGPEPNCSRLDYLVPHGYWC